MKNIFHKITITDKNLKALLKNFSFLFVSDLWVYGISLVQGLIVARALGVGNYGLLALVITYVTIVNQVFDFRVHETATKYISEFWTKNENAKVMAMIKLCYLIDLSTGVLAFIVVFISAGIASSLILHNPALSGLITFYAIKLLFSTLEGTSNAILGVFDRFTVLSYYSVFQSVLQLLAVVFFLIAGYGIKGVLAGYLLTACLSGIVQLILVLRSLQKDNLLSHYNAGISIVSGRRKEIFYFLINTNLNEFFTLFTKNADMLILGFFRTTAEAGYYKLAKSLVSVFDLVSMPLYRVIYPQLAKLWCNNSISEFKSIIKKFTVTASVIIFPAVIIVYFFIPVVINLTVGAAYLPAVTPVRIMLLGTVVSSVFCWLRPSLLSMGKPSVLTYANGFNALTMFILSVLIVPVYGYLGTSALYVYPILTGHLIVLIAFLNYLKKATMKGVS